jgi:hypothetical protein
MSYDGWTDPESVGKGLGALGPSALVFLCFVILAVIVLFAFAALIVWWRGSERLGIIGFGSEYQKTRIAHERTAKATEETKAVEGEIKALLARIAPFLEALAAKFSPPAQGVQPDPPAPQPRASSPEFGPLSKCRP